MHTAGLGVLRLKIRTTWIIAARGVRCETRGNQNREAGATLTKHERDNLTRGGRSHSKKSLRIFHSAGAIECNTHMLVQSYSGPWFTIQSCSTGATEWGVQGHLGVGGGEKGPKLSPRKTIKQHALSFCRNLFFRSWLYTDVRFKFKIQKFNFKTSSPHSTQAPIRL